MVSINPPKHTRGLDALSVRREFAHASRAKPLALPARAACAGELPSTAPSLSPEPSPGLSLWAEPTSRPPHRRISNRRIGFNQIQVNTLGYRSTLSTFAKRPLGFLIINPQSIPVQKSLKQVHFFLFSPLHFYKIQPTIQGPLFSKLTPDV